MRIAVDGSGRDGVRRYAERVRRALRALHPDAVVDRDPDLTFTPSYLLPPPDGPEVVCVHDFAERFRPQLEARLERGSRIVCPSQATADLIPEADPVVVHPGVDPTRFSPGGEPEGDPFLAVVGSQGPLQDEFPVLRARLRPCRVVIVDPQAPRRKAPAVDVVGFLPEPELVTLYRRARVVVIPSMYEGYGPSVLEAMACGAPVACADTPAFREFAGEAARYFDPRCARSIADAMAELSRDEAARAALSRKGPAQAAGFGWERTARRLFDVFREVLA